MPPVPNPPDQLSRDHARALRLHRSARPQVLGPGALSGHRRSRVGFFPSRAIRFPDCSHRLNEIGLTLYANERDARSSEMN